MSKLPCIAFLLLSLALLSEGPRSAEAPADRDALLVGTSLACRAAFGIHAAPVLDVAAAIWPRSARDATPGSIAGLAPLVSGRGGFLYGWFLGGLLTVGHALWLRDQRRRQGPVRHRHRTCARAAILRGADPRSFVNVRPLRCVLEARRTR